MSSYKPILDGGSRVLRYQDEVYISGADRETVWSKEWEVINDLDDIEPFDPSRCSGWDLPSVGGAPGEVSSERFSNLFTRHFLGLDCIQSDEGKSVAEVIDDNDIFSDFQKSQQRFSTFTLTDQSLHALKSRLSDSTFHTSAPGFVNTHVVSSAPLSTCFSSHGRSSFEGETEPCSTNFDTFIPQCSGDSYDPNNRSVPDFWNSCNMDPSKYFTPQPNNTLQMTQQDIQSSPKMLKPSNTFSTTQNNFHGRKPIKVMRNRVAKRYAVLGTFAKVYQVICPDCGIAVASRGHLKRHMLAHGASRSHPCNICSCSFSKKCVLKNHIRRAHGLIDEIDQTHYLCPFCDWSSSYKAAMVRHGKVHQVMSVITM